MKFPRLLALLLAGAALPALAGAQAKARLTGAITDEAGNPLAGVKVIVTTEAMTNFRSELTSNAKGIFVIAILDSTKSYVYRLEKEGFAPQEQEIKLGIGQNEKIDFRMLSLAAAAQKAGVPAANPAIAVYNSGVEAYTQGDLQTAIQKLEEAAQLDPTLLQPHASLAKIYSESGRTADALAAAERALAIDPKNQFALAAAIQAYRAQGSEAKARAAEAALAEVNPAVAAATSYEAGTRLFNEGKSAEAAVELERAVAANPDHARGHYVLGLCYSGLGENAKARQHLEAFIRLAPADPDAASAQEMMKYLQ